MAAQQRDLFSQPASLVMRAFLFVSILMIESHARNLVITNPTVILAG